MIVHKDKLKALHGYFEGSADAVDTVTANLAIDYKKNITRQYMAISPDLIDLRLGGSTFYVTRKYDGELNIIFFDGKQSILLNRSGKLKLGIACIDEVSKVLIAAGVSQAMIPAELYLNEANGRTRIFDVLAALADSTQTDNLRLAVFDLVQLNGQDFKPTSYHDTYTKLSELFANNPLCAPVQYQKVDSTKEVKRLYAEWCDLEGAEGLVVHVDSPMIFKVKPRHNVDVVVVGFSEGTGDQKGQVRSLLLALMPTEGHYQIFGRTGNGMSAEFKQELLAKLSPLIIESSYMETDSNHVAFHMVQPSMVIELKITDVLFESTSGPIMNTVLEVKNNSYRRISDVPGVSFVFPIFERIRHDKTAVFADVRLNQIEAFTYYPPSEIDHQQVLNNSFILYREVYKKVSGNKLMVQKFMVWKTNKENVGYPAYVLHYTNFSSDRKEPLQREVLISDNEDQMKQMLADQIAENVKKGWTQVEIHHEELAGW